MSALYLSEADQHQRLEWLNGGVLTMLLDGRATDGQLMMGRFSVDRGEAPPFHTHHNEDEIFMLLQGTALLWHGEDEYELNEGGVVYLPRGIPHSYRITSAHADLLMINTPAGIEGMFRAAGRDMSEPRPEGFSMTPDPALAARYGSTIVGPPR